MTEQTITVSDGTNFFRIPLSDLPEATTDGFYVPALRGRTIVSDGKELFEIPSEDAADAEADGFQDILLTEKDLVLSLQASAGAAAEEFAVPMDIPENFSEAAGETVPVFDSTPSEVFNATSLENLQSEVPSPQILAPSSRKQRKKEADAASPKPAAIERASAGAEAKPLPLDVETPEEEEEPKTFKARLHRLLHPTAAQRRKMGVLALNTGIHVGTILILAAIFLPSTAKENILLITSSFDPKDAVTEEMEAMEIDQPMEISESAAPAEKLVDTKIESMETIDVDINDLDLSSLAETVDPNSKAASAKAGKEAGGRSQAGRAMMVAKMGGTAASEAAVQRSLLWFSNHQKEDGGWSFDHGGGECNCSQPGSMKDGCRNAATGLGLLAMLGAGQTPGDGEFQKQVQRGVEFLLANSSAVPAGLDVRGNFVANGGMYTHAIATTALCESLAMLQHEVERYRGDDDQRAQNKVRVAMIRQLEPRCEGAINFIVNAQHPTNGSWGYNPGASGDTSILGWQVMALKSAAHAHVPFNAKAVVGANVFLNSVQTNEGLYGYGSKADAKPSTTAIGIVCRMLSGMPRTEPRLKSGVEYLSAKGPDLGNMYLNYYGTQVMMNYGGEQWTKWNEVMREFLVSTQIKEGHAAGSWDLRDVHGASGGRVYMTALCTMTLEVYYRYMPLYGMPKDYDKEVAKEAKEAEKELAKQDKKADKK